MWLFTLLLAAVDHTAADVAAKRIDALGTTGRLYTVSAGQAYSLEGSTGEAIADHEGHVRKITMVFLGETYRQDMVVYVDGGKPVSARVTTGRYRGGIQDPKVVGTSTELFYFDGTDKDAELSGVAAKLAKAITDCIAQAHAKPACDEVDPVFDLQPSDDDARIQRIKSEFAATTRERGRYERQSISDRQRGITGTAYSTGPGRLRLVALEVAGAPKMTVELYFDGTDLLFALMKGTTTTRVYYDGGRVIRILGNDKKRIRVNSESIATHVEPLADYLGIAQHYAR